LGRIKLRRANQQVKLNAMPNTDQEGQRLRLWERIGSPSSIRDFFVLASGAGFGQLVIVAVTPVITRLLLPADMGLFGTFTTFVAIFTVVSSLGFETAIIGARDEDALPLVGIVCTLTIAINFTMTVVLWIMIEVGIIGNLPFWFPWLILLDTILANCFSAAQYWYVREERYKRASLGSFAFNSGRGIGSIICALILPGSIALPIGDCVGRSVGLWTLDRRAVVPQALRGLVKTPSVALVTAQRYWKSAFFLMPSVALEVSLFWLPVLLCSTVYGIETAGQVALVQRLLSAPLALVGRSLSDIFQVRITGHGIAIPSRLVRATITVIAGAIALAIPVCIVMVFWGPAIFIFAFGANWALAGNVVAIMAPLMVFQLCGNIITRLLIEIGRQELRLVAFVALLISMLSTFYAGFLMQLSALTTLTIMSVCGCAIFAIWISISLVICRNYARAV
jgi:O-antigen/teichoic acid export membrane protein